MKHFWQKITVVLIFALVLSGCETVGYYSQAAQGQWSIWWQREPISELLASPDTTPELRQQLQRVEAYRLFASQQLALPDNKSYRYYTDIKRPYVVWNVVAAEPLSVEPLTWCFPIAGCVSYRGYFSEQAAIDYAQQLQQQGYETHVGGVAAYSTLGWFDDPLLNTFVSRAPLDLAGLIFHELAHQQVYVAGDTAFNESFATTVELIGVERWAQQQGITPEELNAYHQRRIMRKEFVSLLLDLREQLQALYAQAIPEQEKINTKQQLLEIDFPAQLKQLQQHWGQNTAFAGWLQQPVNNARLSTVASYHQWVPAFQQLLQEQENDLARFYQRVEALAQLDAPSRQVKLLALKQRALRL